MLESKRAPGAHRSLWQGFQRLNAVLRSLVNGGWASRVLVDCSRAVWFKSSSKEGFAVIPSSATKKMMKAARAGDAVELALSIKRGADPKAVDELGWGALRHAIYGERDKSERAARIEAVGALVAAGAYDGPDAEVRTPLMSATSLGCPEMVSLLLPGSAPMAQDRQGTNALMIAARSERETAQRCLELLVPESDPDAKDSRGMTALMQMCQPMAERKVLAMELAKARVLASVMKDLDAQRADGQTALTLALRSGKHAVAALLLPRTNLLAATPGGGSVGELAFMECEGGGGGQTNAVRAQRAALLRSIKASIEAQQLRAVVGAGFGRSADERAKKGPRL